MPNSYPGDVSRRIFLQAAGLLVAEEVLARNSFAHGREIRKGPEQKVILVVPGGVRRQETFSPQGFKNIPHLANDLGPESLFYNDVRNEGVTAHFNAISSILTGTWQQVGDWGESAPTAPTLFEYFRKQRELPASQAWIVASNKALTDLIGASSARGYGWPHGANVVLPKTLMINAVVKAIRYGQKRAFSDPQKAEAQLEAMLDGSNYEGLGWNVFDASAHLDPGVRAGISQAVADLVHLNGPMTGDALTFLVAREIMRKFAPSLLMVDFSDVEVAHFGSYAIHVAGIRNTDALCYKLWQEVKANPEYAGKTTVIILPEFGRDPDGSNTNGFFNHRSFDASCRSTWMMVLGPAIGQPRIIERPVRHIDVCPTLATLLGCHTPLAQGAGLAELQA